jgi:hypothetical protein
VRAKDVFELEVLPDCLQLPLAEYNKTYYLPETPCSL